MSKSPPVSVRFETDPETEYVVAYVTVGKEEYLTQGRDHAEALISASDLVYLILDMCPKDKDRNHCFCLPDIRNNYIGGTDNGHLCCKCETWKNDNFQPKDSWWTDEKPE